MPLGVDPSYEVFPDISKEKCPDCKDPKNIFQCCNLRIEPGTFTLGPKIGEGAFGIIYKCKLATGRTVAGKKLKEEVLVCCKSPGVDGSAKHSALQAYHDLVVELAVLETVGKHPNLVEFVGACCQDESNPIIFEEFVTGPSLSDFLDTKRNASAHCEPWVPPRSVTYSWITDMMRGLEFLHNRDPVIIHRDMKPGNLLLTKDLTTIKIADFGMCKMVQKGQVKTGQGNAGTEAYMAPEVFHKSYSGYTDKVDIYSAAIIMWAIATGQASTLRYRGDDEHWRPDLGWVEWEELKLILQSAWAAAPDQRPSASQVLASLQRLPKLPPKISKSDFGGPGCCSVQ